MKVALGRLGWPPAVFWAATPHEFWAAFDDWVEVNCIRRDDGALSEDEIERLENMKRRFPDRLATRDESELGESEKRRWPAGRPTTKSTTWSGRG